MPTAHRARLWLPAITAVILGLLAAGACAPSEYRYVTNSATNTYLKVPRDWAQFEQRELVNAEVEAAKTQGEPEPSAVDTFLDQLAQWRIAFDSDPVPSLEHAIQVTSRAPVVDVRVLELQPTQRDQISMSDLRNLFVPYDELKEEAEEEAARKPVLSPTVTNKFRAISEEELSPGGDLRGIRVQFELRSQLDQNVYIFDQTALLDSSTQRLYVLMIRGGEEEFLEQSEVLQEIAESFTVQHKDS